MALNKRLGCLEGDLPENSEPAQLIRIVDDVFTYSGKLDFQPSIWKYIATPTFKKAMKVYDEQTTFVFKLHMFNACIKINTTMCNILFFRMCEKLTNEALNKIKQKNDGKIHVSENSEESVLEKLSKIDKNVAIVMSIDMLLAGVDTVLYFLFINC